MSKAPKCCGDTTGGRKPCDQQGGLKTKGRSGAAASRRAKSSMQACPLLAFAAVGDFAVGAEDGAPPLPFEGWAGIGFAAGGYVAVACYVVQR